jgi:hypothetical protein
MSDSLITSVGNQNVQAISPLISATAVTENLVGSHDFKTLFQQMYLLNRQLTQGIVRIASGQAQTMAIQGVGNVDPTSTMGQFVLTTTLGEYENIVGAATNLMDAQRKIEDFLQKIV